MRLLRIRVQGDGVKIPDADNLAERADLVDLRTAPNGLMSLPLVLQARADSYTWAMVLGECVL